MEWIPKQHATCFCHMPIAFIATVKQQGTCSVSMFCAGICFFLNADHVLSRIDICTAGFRAISHCSATENLSQLRSVWRLVDTCEKKSAVVEESRKRCRNSDDSRFETCVRASPYRNLTVPRAGNRHLLESHASFTMFEIFVCYKHLDACHFPFSVFDRIQ
jgi:hypothetical protein